ncbi:3-methyladenine DNA glycosylase [Oerskovia flava]|uniref:3-methyladenine DNA glycosylase n=1 Tax=Oerskovia flava TaxID=2986422 RepID=UPI003CCE4494
MTTAPLDAPTSGPPGLTPRAADRTADAVLPAGRWQAVAAAHAARADERTAGWRERKARGATHAIEDFLFTYYPTRPAQLRRWHPGPGVVLAPPPPGRPDDQHTAYAERAAWRWTASTPHGITLDTRAFLADRGETVDYVLDLLERTAGRPAQFGCFGLHEWAMVYRDREHGRDQRHPLPLRLGHAGTDEVVDSHPVRCTHFDAFRFFTPQATGLNRLQPTRATQPELEQPGCLHATMDLYKWALKLSPAVPGDLLLDCFDLARDVRVVDMQASPYDVSAYGLAPIAIETAEGKTAYVRAQREFTDRGAVLRSRLGAVCSALVARRTAL